MSILGKVTTGIVRQPRRTMIYGLSGIGKTTFGASAESSIIIQTEDGSAMIDCARLPVATTLHEAYEAIAALLGDEHKYKTVVLDSLDWLERLIFVKVCEENNVENIEKIGYGKGYMFALTHWRTILDGLDALRTDRGMDIILVAHSAIVKFADPNHEPYDRHQPKLDKRAAALVMEWCDDVLFAGYKVFLTTDEGSKRKRGKGTGERLLWTTERPAHSAKNRLGLPDEIPLDYDIYAAHVRGETPATA